MFGDVAGAVAGDSTNAELLVPVGQHGHGWEPGPSVRKAIRNADLFVHGMPGFQPWVDDVNADLDADGAGVKTVDVSTNLDLIEAGDDGHDHNPGTDDHDGPDEGEHREDGQDHEAIDPHFWMDPLRLREAVDNVQQGFVDVDPDRTEAYADNAGVYRDRLDDRHETIESTVADASTDVILVAGHNAYRYLADRYGVEVMALTDASPDDRPTPRDIDRAQEVIETHDLAYVCADPLESQKAADQLVSETDAQEVLPLTAMPGLTDEWEAEGWGYVEVMENVNLPTLERALDA